MTEPASLANTPRTGRKYRGKRIRTGSCGWCGRRIRRRPGSRGPLPRSCPTCAERVYVRRRLRAYLRSSRRYALRLRRRDLAGKINGVIHKLDEERRPR